MSKYLTDGLINDLEVKDKAIAKLRRILVVLRDRAKTLQLYRYPYSTGREWVEVELPAVYQSEAALEGLIRDIENDWKEYCGLWL